MKSRMILIQSNGRKEIDLIWNKILPRFILWLVSFKLWSLFKIILVLRNYEYQILSISMYKRCFSLNYFLLQVRFAYSHSMNMVTRTTLKFKKTKARSFTILEIIHQGPQDTIIFHIQNKKVGVNGDMFQCYSYGVSLGNGQNLWFLKNTVARHP